MAVSICPIYWATFAHFQNLSFDLISDYLQKFRYLSSSLSANDKSKSSYTLYTGAFLSLFKIPSRTKFQNTGKICWSQPAHLCLIRQFSMIVFIWPKYRATFAYFPNPLPDLISYCLRKFRYFASLIPANEKSMSSYTLYTGAFLPALKFQSRTKFQIALQIWLILPYSLPPFLQC